MNQYLFYAALAVAGLMLALVVPGLKTIAEAILKMLLDFFTELIKHKSTFIVWGVKTLVGDHIRVIRHATTSRNTLDPTQKIRRKAEGYED